VEEYRPVPDGASKGPVAASLWDSLVPWLPLVFFWMLQVALTATTTVARGQVLTRTQSAQRSIVSWTVWALLAPLIVSIDRRLPIREHAQFKRFIFHIPLSLLFTVLNLYLDFMITSFLNPKLQLSMSSDVLRDWLTGQLQGRFIIYWVVLFVYSTFDYANGLKEEKIRTAELERLVSEARLATLRARLHPHFLFNALNTISAHVERNPRTARRMLEELGDLLRLTLTYAEDPEIRLTDEIAFVKRYLYFQQERFEERLTVKFGVDNDTLDALVPTFILQPLVENAIHHGIAPQFGGGLVEIRAWREGGSLHLRVQDDGPGLPAGWDQYTNVGIGISNTRERLRRLYGDREQSFRVFSEANRGVCVDLVFPLRDSGREVSLANG
jgi:two-component system LytT family sensor kinase